MVTRRKFLTWGILGLTAAVGGGLAWKLLGEGGKAAESSPVRERSAWFEALAEEPSDDKVVLEFVDEADNPVDFTAFLLWEPDGEVDEVAIRGGRLELDKKQVKEQVDRWKDWLKERDQPLETENTLFTILPISLTAEFLPYTDIVAKPKLKNKKYKVRGQQKKKQDRSSHFATCPEAKVVYVSDINLSNYVPAVALRDTSSKAFGEYIDFSYIVNGSALKFNVYGGLSLGFGTQMRITGEQSWSTGNLNIEGGRTYIFKGLDESAAIMFYSTIWRYIVYDVYDLNTCGVVDERADLYLLNLGFENGSIALRSVGNLPAEIFSSTQISESRYLQGIDGKGGDANMLRWVDMLVNEPLIDVSGSIHVGGWPVGGIINKLGYPYSELIKRLHVGFGFQVYGGKANYVSTVVTDANASASYILGIHRASYTHYLKDYVFRPLNIMGTLLDS